MPTASPPEPNSSSTLANGEAAPPPDVLIAGASTRAAAFSAIRAGLQPLCIDQFADTDLRRVAEARRVDDYPGGLRQQAAKFPGVPLVYTGALENHPRVLQDLCEGRPLLGNSPDTVAAVRDPLKVHDALRSVKVPCLTARPSTKPPLADATWMLKPLRGAGGRGISVWDDAATNSPTLDEPHYFQRRGEGEAISAVFLAHQNPFQIRYVGLTRQLIGLPELHAPRFAWCGSIGPVALDVAGEILVRRIGSVIAHQFGLRGFFGCDFLLPSPDRPTLLEVNPRYTASVEILEMLCGLNLMLDHCQATGYDGDFSQPAQAIEVPTGVTVGKVIVYAEKDGTMPDTSSWTRMTPFGPLPALADLPAQGTPLRKGHPVCSILAAAASEGECQRYLLRRAAEVTQRLAE